jgi:hypothetical protein
LIKPEGGFDKVKEGFTDMVNQNAVSTGFSRTEI